MGEQDSSPVIIFGAPRSGTTYLNEILNKHPDIFITNESRLFVWVHRSLHNLAEDEQVLLDRRDQFLDHVRSVYPQSIRDFYRKLAPGARLWGDKYPNYASLPNKGCLDTIADLYPDARFIHIIRDGRDVMSSLLRKRWGNLERAPQIWSEHIEIGRAFGLSRPARLYHELRYEDLIEDDAGVAQGVFEFLGVPMSQEALVVFHGQVDG